MLYRSTLVSEARGSAGGLTASRNRSGNYLRKRIKPTNVGSSDRTRARNDLGGASSNWPQLTQEQRDAWNAFAANQPVSNGIGETVNWTGQNWYVRINSLRSLGGLAALTSPPTGTGTTLLTDISITALDDSANTVTFTIDNTNEWANFDAGRLFVFATQPLSPGRQSTAGSFRFVGSVDGDATTPPTSPQTITLTGGRQPINTQAQFFRFVAMDQEGRVSVTQIKRAVAVP